MGSVKVGLIGCTRKSPQLRMQEIQSAKNYNAILGGMKRLCQNLHFELVAENDAVVSVEDVVRIVQRFREERVNMVIVLVTGFSMGDLASELASYLKSEQMPAVLWGIPEGDGDVSGALSFVGENFWASIFHKRNIRFKWIFGGIEDTAVQEQLLITVKAANVIKRFRSAKIAILGNAFVPTFYDLDYDEMGLEDRFGVTVERVDLSVIFKLAGEAPGEDIEAIVTNTKGKAEIYELSDDDLKQVARFYWAMKRIVEQKNYAGIAVRSWPEFQEVHHATPDAAIAMLNDEGLVVSDEADLLGLISMLASSYACDGDAKPTLLDMIGFNEKTNSVALWHPGSSAPDLARNGEVRARKHFENSLGAVYELSFKEGPATLVRFSGAKGERLLVVQGNVTTTPAISPVGSSGELQLPEDLPVKNLINTIMVNGVEHHYSLARTHHAEVLREVAFWLSVELIKIVGEN